MSSLARSLCCVLMTVPFASLMMQTAQGQQADQHVECVNRTATAAPPPHPMAPAPRRAGRNAGGGEQKDREAAMKPVCPEGQVPVTKDMKIERQVPAKGNPLIRPRAGGQPAPQQGVLKVSPTDVRTFREIYRPQRTGNAPPARPGPPGGPPGPPSCAGVPSFGSCYYYGSAGLTRAADGGGMTMSVDSPAYDNSGGPGHSLNEIAVQGGTGNGNIVELGWLVSSDQNGDDDPHIFVFHWKNWTQTCYNGCGWQQYSSTYFPGQNVKPLVGRDVYVGYVFYNGNWWAWFDDQWLGYFPGSEWNNTYKKSALLQWFGEVASQNGIPPKTQMGDGVFNPTSKAARMFTLCDVDAKAWVCWVRDQQSVSATVPKYYNIARTGFGDTRYGGPGQ